MPQQITPLESLNFAVGDTRLENAVRLACKNLGMKFKKNKIIDKGLEYETAKIRGKDKEYEIRKLEEYTNTSNSIDGGHYLYDYSLFRIDKGFLYPHHTPIIESKNFAFWNQFDETTKVENFTALYSKDRFGRETFRILKNRGNKKEPRIISADLFDKMMVYLTLDFINSKFSPDYSGFRDHCVERLEKYRWKGALNYIIGQNDAAIETYCDAYDYGREEEWDMIRLDHCAKERGEATSIRNIGKKIQRVIDKPEPLFKLLSVIKKEEVGAKALDFLLENTLTEKAKAKILSTKNN